MIEDLTGKIIGKYKVLKRLTDELSYNGTIYEVECTKCGWIGPLSHETVSKALTDTNCSHINNYFKDFNGIDIGKYHIISFDHEEQSIPVTDPYRHYWYRCKCKICGYTTIMSLDSIYESKDFYNEDSSRCMHPYNDTSEFIGKEFGKYKVLEVLNNEIVGDRIKFKVECLLCGFQKECTLNQLKTYSTHLGKTCQHNISWPDKRLSNIYKGMVQRCENAKSSGYKRYGGKGIRVVDEWKGYQGKNNFINDALSKGYTPGCDLSIDRIDGNGDYCPENTQWVSKYYNTVFTDSAVYIRIKFLEFDKLLSTRSWGKFVYNGNEYYKHHFSAKEFPDKKERTFLITADILNKLSNTIEETEGKILPGAMVELNVKPIGDFNEDGEFIYKVDNLQLIIDQEEKSEFDFDLGKLRKDNDDDDDNKD